MSKELITINTEWLSDCSGCISPLWTCMRKSWQCWNRSGFNTVRCSPTSRTILPQKSAWCPVPIRNEHDRHNALEMRKSCELIIAWGSCAVFGGSGRGR